MPEIIDKILEANFANIAKKVASGKPLSKAELDLVSDRGEREKKQTKKEKTPPSSHTWPVFDSQSHCSGATGIPIEILKRLKADGCPAFKSNRIHFAELLPQLVRLLTRTESGTPEITIETYADLLDKQKFEERAGILVEFEEAVRIAREPLMPIRQLWVSLPSALCMRCNPSDPQHARAALEVWVKQGMRLLADSEREKIDALKATQTTATAEEKAAA